MITPAKRLPIKIARAIAKNFGQRQVIIVAWDGEKQHVVTYGKNATDCDQAAQGGDFVKKALGWPASLKAMPSRVNSQRLRLELKEDGFWLHVKGNGGKVSIYNIKTPLEGSIAHKVLHEAVGKK